MRNLFVFSFLFNSEISAEDHIRPSAIIKLPENENAILVEKKSDTVLIQLKIRRTPDSVSNTLLHRRNVRSETEGRGQENA